MKLSRNRNAVAGNYVIINHISISANQSHFFVRAILALNSNHIAIIFGPT